MAVGRAAPLLAGTRRRAALPATFAAAALAAFAPCRARACGWDGESYHAEAKSLPCVYSALTGIYPKHTPEYLETRAAAAAVALSWVPDYGPALDDEGIALMKLGRLAEARAVMERRLQVEPDAYASHANLGTLYTFTGDYDLALVHIDRGMKIEPAAHFGREGYHRRLVVYLKAVAADPKGATEKDFLGLSLTPEQRLSGSPAKLAAAGIAPDAIDALVSMITVYGANHVSHVYVALGDLLALRGDIRLAWTAYADARALGHPRSGALGRWQNDLQRKITEEHFRDTPPRPTGHIGGYKGMDRGFGGAQSVAASMDYNYGNWERQQLKRGLPVWREEGLSVVYAKQHQLRKRCAAPGIIDERPADPRLDDAAAKAAGVGPPSAAPADAKAEPYLAAFEGAAALTRKPGLPCEARAKAEADYRRAHAAALGAPPRFGALSMSQRARLTRALDALVDAAMECRPAGRRPPRPRAPPVSN
jgi:tetratricopeptide (TPR) repeat protein